MILFLYPSQFYDIIFDKAMKSPGAYRIVPRQESRPIMKMHFLPNIKGPDDVKALSAEALSALVREIRAFLVEHVTKNGGHLASNLGVVELTVAMHRVFDSPRDHLIFDVGHQSYVHKILTGRAPAFETNSLENANPTLLYFSVCIFTL